MLMRWAWLLDAFFTSLALLLTGIAWEFSALVGHILKNLSVNFRLILIERHICHGMPQTIWPLVGLIRPTPSVFRADKSGISRFHFLSGPERGDEDAKRRSYRVS